MPWKSLTYKPGLNVQLTPTLNRDGYSTSSLVRWKDGVPEQIGGWVSFNSTAVSGRPSALWSWYSQTLSTNLVAVGTTTKLQLYTAAGVTHDITPSVGFPGTTNALPWTLVNWGEDLIALPVSGTQPFVWLPSSGYGTPAALISNAPQYPTTILVGMPEQHLICFGGATAGSVGSPIQPNFVQWSDVSDYTTWIPTQTNSAGNFYINQGSRIVGALRSSQQILIWTDAGLTGMQFVSTPYIYSFQEIAVGCGLLAFKAAAVIGAVAFWMSYESFWIYNGVAQPLECPVRDLVFGNLNLSLLPMIFTAVNAQFSEVWWFYPSLNATDVDSYVAFNYQTGLWSAGSLARTAWIDRGVFPYPIATDSTGNLWDHENGNSAGAGNAIYSTVTSGYTDLAEGEQQIFMDALYPDVTIVGSGPVNMTLLVQQESADSPLTVGPFTITSSTDAVALRCRGKQVAFQVSNTSANTFYRVGRPRIRFAPDGRK